MDEIRIRTPSGEETPPATAAISPPELTVKAVLLGVVLSALLAGANAYLGLLAGMTVSASIPAAVASMAVLRLFGRTSVLENNIVQTAASAGESLAAGAIFTFPALIILGAWSSFDYWQTTIVAATGGVIGVLFTIPLRRALIIENPLAFPEGVATAEVLRAGSKEGAGAGSLAAGAALGAIFKLGSSGLGLWAQSVEGARRIGSAVFYLGANLLPALLAVGYIVRINIAALVFAGSALNWFIAIPLYALCHAWPDGLGPAANAWQIWSAHTRYIGVGAMVVGGLWALFRLWRTLLNGIVSGLRAYRASRGRLGAVPRTRRDMPITWVAGALLIAIIPLFFVCESVIHDVTSSAVMAIIMLSAGFLFTAVAAYMAGIVGSSNNPVSGVTIATLLFASLILVLLLHDEAAAAGPAAAILIGAVVCCAAAIGGDNMQDLKTGNLVGATPIKQQIMQLVGVIAAAAVIAPVLTLLLNAYGIVEAVSPDRAPLPAPQATLMAAVARGVFSNDLPWVMVAIGAVLASGVIVLDESLARHGSGVRAPVLAVAVGIYLPLELVTPILAGGIIAWAAARRNESRSTLEADAERGSRPSETAGRAARSGLLFAAGLITGEALLGILLAVPIVLTEGRNPLDLGLGAGRVNWLGAALMAAVAACLFRAATRNPKGPARRRLDGCA